MPTPDNLAYNGAVAKLDEAVYALIARRRAKRTGADGDVRVAAAKEGEANPRRVPRVVWDAAAKDWVPTDSSPSADRFSEETDATDATSVRAPDLLDRLLDAVDEEGDGAGMDDVSLRDELMTLMVAGQETSAILLSWVCAFLAQHPAVAARCAAEAEAVIGPDPLSDLPTAESYARLKYCEAVVYEAMRLAPPAYMVGRCCAEDVRVAGYDLPKGTTVLVAPYLLHRDERYWSRPLRVRPRPVAKRGALRVPPEGHGPERRVRPLRRGSARVHRHGLRHDGGDAPAGHGGARRRAALQAGRGAAKAARAHHAATGTGSSSTSCPAKKVRR